jgi:hypothetical protein
MASQNTATRKQRIYQILEANAELCVVLKNPTLVKSDKSLPMFRCRMLISMDDIFFTFIYKQKRSSVWNWTGRLFPGSLVAQIV